MINGFYLQTFSVLSVLEHKRFQPFIYRYRMCVEWLRYGEPFKVKFALIFRGHGLCVDRLRFRNAERRAVALRYAD